LDRQRSVLIVDPSEDTREVLQMALERRGVQTFSASQAAPALELAERHRPDLIVLDVEMDASILGELSTPFVEQSQTAHTPLVMLGSVRRNDPEPPQGEFVAKPYHYGPLVRKIEELLTTVPPSAARDA